MPATETQTNTTPDPTINKVGTEIPNDATSRTLAGADVNGPVNLGNATAQPNALVIPTEGTPEHESFRQEFDEFLQSAERDAKEVIAWLKSKF